MIPRSCQTVTDLYDFLRSFVHHFRASELTLAHLSPTQGRPAFPSIQSFERSCPDTGVVTVVVGELHQRQVSLPTLAKIDDTCPQHVLQCLYRPLTLAVSLRMISRTHIQLSTQGLMKSLPETRSKAGITIRNDRNRHPVPRDHLLKVEPSQPLESIRFLNRY